MSKYGCACMTVFVYVVVFLGVCSVCMGSFEYVGVFVGVGVFVCA